MTIVAVVAAVPATWVAVKVFHARIQEISVFLPVESGAGVFAADAGGCWRWAWSRRSSLRVESHPTSAPTG